MTSINITTAKCAVTVTEGGKTTVVSVPRVSVVTATTVGPQGGSGTSFFSQNEDVDTRLCVDKSLVYYNAATSKFMADADVTTLNLTDGGNF